MCIVLSISPHKQSHVITTKTISSQRNSPGATLYSYSLIQSLSYDISFVPIMLQHSPGFLLPCCLASLSICIPPSSVTDSSLCTPHQYFVARVTLLMLSLLNQNLSCPKAFTLCLQGFYNLPGPNPPTFC